MKSIGKYQVIEELGASATGKTYRVRDAFRNREFAAKILQSVPGLGAEAKEQFCGQLAACAELTHRHIAKIHDLGEVDEGIFIATEWRTGMDLRRFTEENEDLPLGQKLAVIAQVAEGLSFAHSRGITHGNLKPSNIFVDAERDVSILDFGTAKWLAALLDAGCRPEGLTPSYLAPEQVLGQPFDARSDIFALGVMLYEFASGKHPFAADPDLIPREIVHSDQLPLNQLDAQMPQELGALVERALTKDPEQRLQTAEEFASGLYLAAQQLRRSASVAVAPDPPSVEQMAVDPSLDYLAPALTPEQVIAPPEPPQGAPPRERPQDAQAPSRPWTSRSYAAGAPLAASNSADIPKQPAIPTPAVQSAVTPPLPTPPARLEPPTYEPPKSFLRPTIPEASPIPAPQPKVSKTTRRLLTAAVGLVLAAAFVGSLVSRQNLKASQNKTHAVNTVTAPVAPVTKPTVPPAAPTPVPETQAPKSGESGPDDVGNPEFSAKQTLRGPVRSLWESGRYNQALALVNQVLANDPSNEDARSWKKKIHDAQAAEAALK
jgi:serine/threonine-protein kinase